MAGAQPTITNQARLGNEITHQMAARGLGKGVNFKAILAYEAD